MISSPLLRRPWLSLIVLALAGGTAAALALEQNAAPLASPAQPPSIAASRPDEHTTLATVAEPTEHNFTTSTTQSTEASLLVQLLENDHYNHANVHSSDYAEAIPDYMTALDGQHLFYLGSDKAKFTQEYGKNYVYYNVAYLGNIDAAYEMYNTYEARATARINWIFAELKKNFDFTGNDAYAIDRSKAEWPATQADSDDLWRSRLKFEVLAEILSKKTPQEAKDAVHKRYEVMLKNLDDIEASDLAELYLTSIAALYDPHSNYFSADTFEDFSIQMKLQLVGIGAMLEMKDDYCTIEELVPGGPSELEGELKPNDKIVAVAQDSGEPVEIIGMKLRKIVNLIRGAKGTRVHLLVEPAGAADASTRKDIVITRDVVKLNSARAHGGVFQVPGADGKIVPLGVIALPEFYGPADDSSPAAEKTSASQDVAQLIGQLKNAGVKGIVLDLRHNGGGFLTEAINLTGLFIKAGPVVQVRNSNGQVDVDSATDTTVAYDGPLAVLVDRLSASASEIVAGALQNYGRAIVVGDSSTHGKGTVQTVLEMKQISKELADSPAKTGAAKITVQKFYLPNGSSTQLKGVVPDIILPAIDDNLPSYIPIGESSLPHAMIWDRIASSHFDGALLEPKVLAPLRQASLARQGQLDEFAYLNKIVDWFKARKQQKVLSLSLAEREKEKADDEAFKKELAAERTQLLKNEYALTEFRLGPPPPPKVKATTNDDGTIINPDDPDESDILSTDDDPQVFGKMDVHLRETLRVLNDAINLGSDRANWASNHAPLTIAEKG